MASYSSPRTWIFPGNCNYNSCWQLRLHCISKQPHLVISMLYTLIFATTLFINILNIVKYPLTICLQKKCWQISLPRLYLVRVLSSFGWYYIGCSTYFMRYLTEEEYWSSYLLFYIFLVIIAGWYILVIYSTLLYKYGHTQATILSS